VLCQKKVFIFHDLKKFGNGLEYIPLALAIIEECLNVEETSTSSSNQRTKRFPYIKVRIFLEQWFPTLGMREILRGKPNFYYFKIYNKTFNGCHKLTTHKGVREFSFLPLEIRNQK